MSRASIARGENSRYALLVLLQPAGEGSPNPESSTWASLAVKSFVGFGAIRSDGAFAGICQLSQELPLSSVIYVMLSLATHDVTIRLGISSKPIPILQALPGQTTPEGVPAFKLVLVGDGGTGAPALPPDLRACCRRA